jgi:hypothetical protein
VSNKLLLALFTHLVAVYHLPFPLLVDLLDGYAADFSLLGTDATLMVDNWTLSLASASEKARNSVLADFQALPLNYFCKH